MEAVPSGRKSRSSRARWRTPPGSARTHVARSTTPDGCCARLRHGCCARLRRRRAPRSRCSSTARSPRSDAPEPGKISGWRSAYTCVSGKTISVQTWPRRGACDAHPMRATSASVLMAGQLTPSFVEARMSEGASERWAGLCRTGTPGSGLPRWIGCSYGHVSLGTHSGGMDAGRDLGGGHLPHHPVRARGAAVRGGVEPRKRRVPLAGAGGRLHRGRIGPPIRSYGSGPPGRSFSGWPW